MAYSPLQLPADRASVPLRPEQGGSPRAQLKRELAGLDYAAQVERLQPPPVPALHAPGELVQLRGDKAAKAYANYDMSGLAVSETHMFQGEVVDNDPKGLHAYTNGSLPGGIQVLATLGNTNAVHTIIWTMGKAATNKRAKWSGMFPQPMPKGTVCYFLQEAARIGGTATVPGEGNDREPGRGRLPGTGWSNITIRQPGDTMYPVGGPSYQDACTFDNRSQSWQITVNRVTYTIVN